MIDKMLKEISTRAIYLKPNAYSDESICIGVLYEDKSKVGIKSNQSLQAYEVLKLMYGDDLVENLTFSLKLLYESVSKGSNILSEITVPTDILSFGPLTLASVENTQNYVSDLLRISSSLYRNYRVVTDRDNSKSQEAVVKEFKQAIVDINPLLGRKIVETKKVQVRDKRMIEIPIYGEKIIGAPISISISKPGLSIDLGEAYIAKLNWARKALKEKQTFERSAIIYVYVPEMVEDKQRNKIEDGIYELEEIGKASSINVFSSHDMTTLAKKVYEHEGISLNS